MTQLAGISGKEAVKALETAGWQVKRISKKGHVILKKEGSVYLLSIPLHKELKIPLLKKQVKRAGLTVKEFLKLL